MELRLPFEFIPAPCRGRNLHAVLPREEWDRVRRAVYALAGYRCAACGTAGVPLQANEQWDYDDEHRVQRLVGVTCLCERCHAVAHSNWSGGPLTPTEVQARFCRVNGCTESAYLRLRSHALAWWQERSRWRPWTTDYGPYAPSMTAHEPCRDGASSPSTRSASPEAHLNDRQPTTRKGP